jgi:hypothetical protein
MNLVSAVCRPAGQKKNIPVGGDLFSHTVKVQVEQEEGEWREGITS